MQQEEIKKRLHQIFNKIDPIGVADMVEEEYGPEVDETATLLKNTHNRNDIENVIYKVINEMLGQKDAQRYSKPIAEKIFEDRILRNIYKWE